MMLLTSKNLFSMIGNNNILKERIDNIGVRNTIMQCIQDGLVEHLNLCNLRWRSVLKMAFSSYHRDFYTEALNHKQTHVLQFLLENNFRCYHPCDQMITSYLLRIKDVDFLSFIYLKQVLNARPSFFHYDHDIGGLLDLYVEVSNTSSYHTRHFILTEDEVTNLAIHIERTRRIDALEVAKCEHNWNSNHVEQVKTLFVV
jgi:hypothetical protein